MGEGMHGLIKNDRSLIRDQSDHLHTLEKVLEKVLDNVLEKVQEKVPETFLENDASRKAGGAKQPAGWHLTSLTTVPTSP
jgi:hypothetical protein